MVCERWCAPPEVSVLRQGRPPPHPQKVCRFQVPKTNPLDMARCCSYSHTKISKCGNTSLVHGCNFFSVGNRTCIVSYSHFPNLHVCTLAFLYLFFGGKKREIDHAVIPSEVVCLQPYPPQFLKCGHVPPHPLHTIIQQSKMIILCSTCAHTQTLRTATSCFTKVFSLCRNLHFDFCFGGQGGDAGSVTCTCASLGVQGGAWTAFTSTCHKEGSVFWT